MGGNRSTMDDLDEQLLALHGGQKRTASAKQNVSKKKRRVVSDSDSSAEEEQDDAANSSDEEQSEEEQEGARNRLTKRRAEEPAAPISSDDEDSDDEFAELGKYDDEGYGDNEDKERLYEMNEIEREQLLAQRVEDQRALRQRRNIRDKMNQRKEASKQVERQARPTRTGDQKDDKRAALEDLRRRKSGTEKKKRAMEAYPSDKESESQSDKEDQESKSEEEELDWDELKKIIPQIFLPRQTLEKWHDKPFFDATVVGCFVKVNLGQRKDTGEAAYRVCQVKEVKEKARAYKLGNQTGDWCRKALELAWGDKTKAFEINVTSNDPPDEKLLEYWKRQMDDCNVDLPLKQEIDNAQLGIEKAENFVYDNSEIDSMIAGGDTTKQGNIAVRKDRLRGMINKAGSDGRTDDYNKYNQQLDELLAEEDDVKKEQGRTEKIAAGVTHINARSRIENRKTEQEVAMMNRRERVEGGDDFIRRPTKNVCYFNMPGTKEETEPAADFLSPRAKAPEVPEEKPKSVLEKIVQLKLDIDLSLLDNATPKLCCPQPSQQRPNKIFPSSTMSLQQYHNLAQEQGA